MFKTKHNFLCTYTFFSHIFLGENKDQDGKYKNINSNYLKIADLGSFFYTSLCFQFFFNDRLILL